MSNTEIKNTGFAYKVTLWLIASIFIFLVLLLNFYNRLAADDFYFYYAQKSMGTLACVKASYASFSGRWLAYSLTCWLLKFADYSWFLVAFGFAVLSLTILCMHLLLNRITTLSGMILSPSAKVMYSILLTTSFFFSNFGVAENWFWFTSVCSYLISLLALIILLFEISKSKISTWGIVLLFVLPLYIGGASESFALISILCLLVLLRLSFTNNARLKTFIKTNHRIKIFLALLFLLISFSITAFAPGNFIRLSMLSHPNALHQLAQPFRSLAKLFFLLLTHQLLYLILLSLPWFFLGMEQRKNEGISLFAFFNQVKLILIALVVLIFVMLLPSSLLLNEAPPIRALSQVSFILCLSAALLLYYAGKSIQVNEKTTEYLKWSSAVITLAFLFYTLIFQWYTTSRYAQSYDERMKILKEIPVKSLDPIELMPLPQSGFLYSAEISTDTAFYTNLHLQRALKLKVPIKRQSNALQEE